MTNIAYNKNVLDFVAVAVQFCAILEKDEVQPRAEWIDNMLKLLPLLYVKASLLPETWLVEDEELPTFVKEGDYMRVGNQVVTIMGEDDTYLDVFMDEMKYSDTPLSAFVSENMADIYQDIRNFVSVYQFELTDQMNDAVFECTRTFREYWGQKLVNILRPLHALKYSDSPTMDEELNQEDLWD